MTADEIAEAQTACSKYLSCKLDHSISVGQYDAFARFAMDALPKALDALAFSEACYRDCLDQVRNNAAAAERAEAKCDALRADNEATMFKAKVCDKWEGVVNDRNALLAERDALKLTVEQQAGEIERLKWPTVSAMGAEIESLKSENQKLTADNAALRPGGSGRVGEVK